MSKNKKKPTSEMNAGRAARRIANVINDRGWTKFQLENDDGSVCLRGANQYAHRFMNSKIVQDYETNISSWMLNHIPDEELKALGSSAKEFKDSVSIFGGSYYFPVLNDTVFTSKEDVIQWLNKCADDLDPQ